MKPKISTLCGLARGFPQWPVILDSSCKPKISRSNFLVDLKAQSTLYEKNIGLQQCVVTLWFCTTPGRIPACGLRIRRAGILEFKNVVISTNRFYTTFSTSFWFREELFGNIWPWRAQFGHNFSSNLVKKSSLGQIGKLCSNWPTISIPMQKINVDNKARVCYPDVYCFRLIDVSMC